MAIVRARRQEPEASPSVRSQALSMHPRAFAQRPVCSGFCGACISWLLLCNKHSNMEQLTSRTTYYTSSSWPGRAPGLPQARVVKQGRGPTCGRGSVASRLLAEVTGGNGDRDCMSFILPGSSLGFLHVL